MSWACDLRFEYVSNTFHARYRCVEYALNAFGARFRQPVYMRVPILRSVRVSIMIELVLTQGKWKTRRQCDHRLAYIQHQRWYTTDT